MSTKAELFVLRCSINQAICLLNIKFIQLQSREFFKKDSNNSIEFWDCSSNCKWSLHDIVDKETKKFDLISIFSYKSSWDFSKENKCDIILNNWKMFFQASDDKGQNFLDLLDNDLKPIELSTSKDKP